MEKKRKKSLKGKTNAWITKGGQFHEVGYMEHNNWAMDYFDEKYGRDKSDEIQEKLAGWGGSGTSALHALGWVRLLTWTSRQTGVYGDCAPNDGRHDTMDPELSDKQKETLQEWCMDNDYKYEDLFKD